MNYDTSQQGGSPVLLKIMLQKTTELPWKYVHTPLFNIKAGYKQQYDSKILVCKFQKKMH